MGMFSEGLSVHTESVKENNSTVTVKAELERASKNLQAAEAAGTLSRCGGAIADFVRALGIPIKEIGESVRATKA